MMASEDGVVAWIQTLRERLDRGEFAGHLPVDVGYGTAAMRAERAIRIMLADLASFDDLTPTEWAEPFNVTRRQNLSDDFRRLRTLIG
jgi:hypothetical protein